MTQEQQDAAWRSLPEDFKDEVKRRYAPFANWGNDCRCINTEVLMLEELFGKHNLTATTKKNQDKTMTKEELLKSRKERRKQTLNIGDKVRAISASGKPLYDGKIATIIEKGMSSNEVYYGLYIEGVTAEKRSTPLIGKSEIIGNTSLLAPFFAEDLELVTSCSEEEKPRFKVGDKVLVRKDFDFGDGASVCYQLFCLQPHTIRGIENGKTILSTEEDWVGTDSYDYAFVPLKDLIPYAIPYTEEQEPKNCERVDFSSSSPQNRKNLTENDISSVSKETAEHLSNLMDEVNNFIERNQDSQVDWLAYRMELAKEVATALIAKGHEIAFVPESTSLIVNGIVKRLKGGLK